MIETINNGDIGAEVRRKLNSNFQQLLCEMSNLDFSEYAAAFELVNVGTADEPDFQLVAKKALFAFNANGNGLKINRDLTKEEYEALREAGQTDPNTLYLIKKNVQENIQ